MNEACTILRNFVRAWDLSVHQWWNCTSIYTNLTLHRRYVRSNKHTTFNRYSQLWQKGYDTYYNNSKEVEEIEIEAPSSHSCSNNNGDNQFWRTLGVNEKAYGKHINHQSTVTSGCKDPTTTHGDSRTALVTHCKWTTFQNLYCRHNV